MKVMALRNLNDGFNIFTLTPGLTHNLKYYYEFISLKQVLLLGRPKHAFFLIITLLLNFFFEQKFENPINFLSFYKYFQNHSILCYYK